MPYVPGDRMTSDSLKNVGRASSHVRVQLYTSNTLTSSSLSASKMRTLPRKVQAPDVSDGHPSSCLYCWLPISLTLIPQIAPLASVFSIPSSGRGPSCPTPFTGTSHHNISCLMCIRLRFGPTGRQGQRGLRPATLTERGREGRKGL